MSADGPAATVDNAAQSSDPSPIQWDGDRMFNIYIYDYCLKRGFTKTAQELMIEAQIPPQSQPPINAKQGLLFEWWSVFWVLFTAKTNGHGTDDAVLYTQHQAHMQQNAAQKHPRGAPQQPVQPGRYTNGIRPPNPPGAQPNGASSNAIPPAGQLNGAQNPIPFPGNAPQTNGVPGTSAGPPGPPGPPGPTGPQPNQNAPQAIPNQRPVPQQRMAGANYQSPTMAHSPPNPPPGSMGAVGTNQPLTQLNMTQRAMLPPNGPSIGSTQQTPQSAYQSLVGRSPSNPGSPAQHNPMAPSPSMAARQPPGMMPQTSEALTAELNRIPPTTLHKLKADMGLPEKPNETMTMDEKQQLLKQFHGTNARLKPGMPGPSVMPPGQPVGPMGPQSGLRNQQTAQNAQQQPMAPPQGQTQQQRVGKRNSNSPGQESEQLPRNDSSPPDRKRVRRSPVSGEQGQPPMAPMYAPPGAQGMQQHMTNGMMRPPMGMAPFPGNPMNMNMNNPMLAHTMGAPQMSPMNAPMNPPMMGAPGPGMGNNNPMHQYRQSMQAFHNKQPHMSQMHSGGVPSPSASDPQGGMPGGPQQGNRMQPQNKPMAGMMPPPSPATAPKTPGGPQKQDDGGVPPNGRVDASPQNAGTGIGGPVGPPQGMPGGPSQVPTPAPPTPNAQPSNIPTPTPSSILGQQPPHQHQPPQPPNVDAGLDPSSFAGLDFGAGLEAFDPNLFGSDAGLNFERDFAEWFNNNPGEPTT